VSPKRKEVNLFDCFKCNGGNKKSSLKENNEVIKGNDTLTKDRKVNYELKYVPCTSNQTVNVYIQGWQVKFSQNWSREENDMFTLITLPVLSTVADVIEYVEKERWENKFKIHSVYQTTYIASIS